MTIKKIAVWTCPACGGENWADDASEAGDPLHCGRYLPKEPHPCDYHATVTEVIEE